MIALGFLLGVAAAAPVFFALGRFRRAQHGLDITAAIERSSR